MRLLKSIFSRRASSRDEIDILKSKIDPIAFQRIYDQYVDADPYPGFSKYLDLDTWIRTALSHVQILDLPQDRRLAILDIGTGAGYLPFVCQNAGHDVQAIDVPENVFYRKIIDLLQVRRCEHRIESFQQLPDLGQRFDVVTAFAICFNNHATDELWGQAEWGFFLSDLRSRMMNPDGFIFLKFNPEPNGQYMTAALQDFFLSQGASINGDSVRLQL